MITDGCVTFVNLLFFICICLAQHVLIKKNDDWFKGCMAYEMEGIKPTGTPKKNWTVVE